jgi:hypothetical protein
MATQTMTISCDDCVLGPGPACDDCVVSFVLGSEESGGIVIDAAEARAVRMLGDAGLVPHLRFTRRAG